MPSYRALAVATSYWKPEEDYLAAIVKAVATRVEDGDFVVVSEKALSTAVGNIIDECKMLPSLNARCLARWWMRILWGHAFSRLLGFGPRLTRNLQEYPLKSGSRHKQLALERSGPLQALMFGSEGGIDGSNLPYAFVSLPLKNAPEIAEEICREIDAKLERKVAVMVVDTDKTFTVRNFHFTPRPMPMRGIHGNGGVVTYVIGRMFRFRKRSTPLAVAGSDIEAWDALRIANIADKARGVGSGTTVWKMAKRFRVDLTGVTWDMLSGIKHKPVVIVRKAKPAEKR